MGLPPYSLVLILALWQWLDHLRNLSLGVPCRIGEGRIVVRGQQSKVNASFGGMEGSLLGTDQLCKSYAFDSSCPNKRCIRCVLLLSFYLSCHMNQDFSCEASFPEKGKGSLNSVCLICNVHTLALAHLCGCALCEEQAFKRAFEGLQRGRRDAIKIVLWVRSWVIKGTAMRNEPGLIHAKGL